MKNKELVIGTKGSYSDFRQCIASRTIGIPKKRSIKENIPFKNGSYDFSAINGEVTYEERDITYTFDIIGINMEDVEKQKRELLEWLMSVQDSDIHDPYIVGYHFHGSYDSFSWSENWEQCELSVTFKVYPYLISDSSIRKSFNLISGDNDIKIFNGGSHKIVPTITTNQNLIIKKGNDSFSIGVGTFTDNIFMLEKGSNELTVTSQNQTATIEFEFLEEVI